LDRILISGASGLIGAALVASLERDGAEVKRLVRGESHGAAEIPWDPKGTLSSSVVSGLDAVVHLAGESVVGRWTPAKKRAIRESRVWGTTNLANAVAGAGIKPKVFVCASAIGVYGDRGDEILTEASTHGTGFPAELGRDWEAAAEIAAKAGIRTVSLRIGLVLSARGGALAKMLPAFKLGLGGRLGSGRQWWSWIHIDDLVGAIRQGWSCAYSLRESHGSNSTGSRPVQTGPLPLNAGVSFEEL
jgi:uncharacterized protein (TIGR01777 family)